MGGGMSSVSLAPLAFPCNGWHEQYIAYCFHLTARFVASHAAYHGKSDSQHGIMGGGVSRVSLAPFAFPCDGWREQNSAYRLHFRAKFVALHAAYQGKDIIIMCGTSCTKCCLSEQKNIV